MSILVNSGTEKDAKNRWGTTWECFNDAKHLFGKNFDVDVAAEPQTAKCSKFIVSPYWFAARAERGSIKGLIGFDSLHCEWPDNWWCNPPFELKCQFIRKAIEQARAGRSGMMLLPYEPTTIWFRKLIKRNAAVIYEPDGRYPFLEIDGKTKKQGVNFASCFVLFTPHDNGGSARTIEFERGIGNA